MSETPLRSKAPKSLVLEIYRLGGLLLGPVAVFFCLWRLVRRQEELHRTGERFGFSSQPRPQGRLVWFHGASIGEVVALLPLVQRLLESDPQLQVLITSTTRASALVLSQRMPERCRHQYVPYDYPGAVNRFLEHWHPELAVWTESELWPHLILGARRHGIPMAQVSAYMSQTSYQRWQRVHRAAFVLLNCFQLCMARDKAAATRFGRLREREVEGIANMKETAFELPCKEEDLAILNESLASRPCWLATNSHEGEELMLARVHARLRQRYPELLLLLAPRRPERARSLGRLLESVSGRVQLRSAQSLPDISSSLYVIDGFGELGLFYRAVSLIFLGGSLIHKGGHNPLEPACLNCFVLHGPNVSAYAALYAELDSSGGGQSVHDEDALAEAIDGLLRDPEHLRRGALAARCFADARGSGIVDDLAKRLLALMAS